MSTEILGVIIASISASFSIITTINQRSARLNERVTRLEVHSEDNCDLPERVTQVETITQFNQQRILSLEQELKESLKELKEIQIQILRSTVK